MISFVGSDPSPSTTKIYRSGAAEILIAGSSPIPLAMHARSQSLHMEQSGCLPSMTSTFLPLTARIVRGHSSTHIPHASQVGLIVMIGWFLYPHTRVGCHFACALPLLRTARASITSFCPFVSFTIGTLSSTGAALGSCGMRSLEVTSLGPSTLSVNVNVQDGQPAPPHEQVS